jgi:nucleoid DNA-binding protein
MKKPEIAKQMALRAGVSAAEAADRLDGIVRQILAELRNGKSASLPGIGRFRTGPAGQTVFEPAAHTRHKGKERG